jgi:hypothetical protein
MSLDPQPNRFLQFLIDTSIGNARQYQITFWSQLILGMLYSFNFFDSSFAGFTLGFALPVFWIILIYRLMLIKAGLNYPLPFPAWMQQNPGNTLIILVDIIILGIIWTMILSGFYSAGWIKFVFTVILPIITLSMLRTLILLPVSQQEDEKIIPHDEKDNF